MRTRPHAHRCDVCGVKTECCGDVEQNYDGIPEWICREYHNDARGEFLCETCEALPVDDRASRKVS